MTGPIAERPRRTWRRLQGRWLPGALAAAALALFMPFGSVLAQVEERETERPGTEGVGTEGPGTEGRGAAVPAPAATDASGGGGFPYRVRRQSLEDVLRFYAERNGLGLVGSGLTRSIEGPITARDGAEFLDKIAAAGGVDLFVYGGTLYASPITDRTTEVMRVAVEGQSALEATLTRLGVPYADYEVTHDAVTGLTVMAGPPPFVSLVSDILSRIETPERVVERELEAPPAPAADPPAADPPAPSPSVPALATVPTDDRPRVTVYRGASRTIVIP